MQASLQSTGLTNLQGSGPRKKGSRAHVDSFTPAQPFSPLGCTGFRVSLHSPHGCQSGHRSQSSSLWMSCPQHWASHCFLLEHRKPERGGVAKGSQVGSSEVPQPARRPLFRMGQPYSPLRHLSSQGTVSTSEPTQSTIQGAAASPTISPGSMPVSSSAHSWGGREGRAEPGQTH